MVFNNVNYNIIILFCIFFMINGCDKTRPKIVVEDNIQNKIVTKIKKANEKNNYLTSKVSKEKIKLKDFKKKNIQNDNKVVFEFKNERLLQGRDFKQSIEKKKTSKALSAVFNMFKQNLSLENNKLNLKNNNKINKAIDYSLNLHNDQNSKTFKNILVFLPFTGKYSNFGIKIRKAIDIGILKFGSNNIKFIYFDTGKDNTEVEIQNLLETVNPNLIIGPFTRESLLKIKPFSKKKSIPVLTFSNDIAMIENNIWSLGFSPEEQVESVISCALMHGYKRFGLIVPNNLYGNIISETSLELIKNNKNNFFDKLLLSNKQINDKKKLFSILKRFLNYTEDLTSKHTKFDTIFLGGSKEFILAIAPLLAFYDVDSKQIQILGTEKYNITEIRNEPSLERSWFPKISSKNDKEFKFIWKETWGNEVNYFSNAGFDSAIIGINFLNQKESAVNFLNNVKGLLTGFIFNPNGYVKKPISIMQIEKLGKLKKIKKCIN